MISWEIFLFGPPRVEHNSQTVSISRRKTVALLAYLAVELRPHSRETLAALMWPEHSAAQAKANLRRDLSRLKNVLSDNLLQIDRTQAGFDPDGDWLLDVQTFQQHIQLLRSHNHFPEQGCAECLEAAQGAAALYTADFMSGFTLPDSPEYDEWQFFTRENLRQSHVELLQRLLGWHTRRGEYEQAIEYGRRRLVMDSLDEHAHRELMRLYAWAGQQAAAIRQYEECVRLLNEELGVSPEPETAELYEAIFARRLSPPEVEKAEPLLQEPPDPSPPSDGERYELGELLAEGGHGVVYLALDRVEDIKVVIKRMKPDLIAVESELLTRFRQEGEILARLNHPNIVRMLDAFQHEGQYHIVMEYVPGGSLRKLLKREKQLESDQAIAIALELADALGRAHHLGIIHRDLKPENVLMAEDGTPRLTDFGVAHLKRADSRLTRTGTILGSPNYISPEMIQNEQLDGRSDIWSLGVLLYEMLAGKTPFGSSQIVTVLFKIINEPELSLLELRPNLPIALVNLIHNMLKKEPAQRPAGMRQVAAVLEAIREGRVPESDAASMTPAPVPIVRKAVPAATSTPYAVPRWSTSFIGREEALAQIQRLVVEEASCRLLTLAGPDGSGKSRLAVEAAAKLPDLFPDGVYFVSLDSVGSVEQMIPAIAQALHLQLSGPADPKAQLIHHLRSKKMLLIADHLEHPVEGGQIIGQLLRLAPHIAFLVTLRERLQLTEEWSYELAGLSLPETAADLSNLETFSAARLFIQRARRARADFTLQSEDAPHIVNICRLLDGSPLGLELAAPWVRAFSPAEIAAKIKESIENLTTRSAGGRSDHLAIRAVFAETWGALPGAEQEALRRLSVFRSGCTAEAVAEIAGASIQSLNALMDKALIRQSSSGRYQIHNIIRQLAAELLESDPEESELIYDIHCRYFLSLLEQKTPSLKTEQEQQVLGDLTADAGNLRAAWEWAVRYRLLEDLSAAAQGYWLYHRFRGLLYEGETTFRQTAETLINAADSELDRPAMEQLAGFFKAGQGDLMARRGWVAEGVSEIEAGLELMRQDEDYDPGLAAFALSALAAGQLAQGRFGAAGETAQESLDLLPRRGDEWARAVCLQLLGSAAQQQGRLAEAEAAFRDCLDICDRLGEQRLQVEAKIGLSRITRLRGRYGRAQQWLDEAEEVGRALSSPLIQADVLREQALLALERGQLEQAAAFLEQCQGIAEAAGRNDGGLTDTYLGRCRHLQGDWDEADNLYRQGLAAAKAAEYDPGIALSLYHIGLLTVDKAQLNQAEQYLQDGLVIWQDLENETMTAQTLRSLGDVTVQAGEQRAADSRAYYRQALQLAVKNGLAPVGLEAVFGLVPLLLRSDEVHRALRLLILTEQHPASSYQVKQATEQYLATFPEDEVTAVRRETVSLDWSETAEDLIAELPGVSWGQKPVHHNLPVHRSAFFGRQSELADIKKYLLEINCRLISIIGPGGIGKTRLAIAAGAALAPHFPQGVFLIPLAPLETADQILIALAEILGVQNLVVDNPKPQLLNYLKRKKMLLIFDNYEHLLPQAAFIADIIETAPDVQMMVTTRQRLNLGSEMVFTLKGMTYPALTETDPEKLAGYDAVQLLVDHAQLARPNVALQPEDYRHIVRICNLVQGMPLALVLAANWLDMLSFAEIAEEIADSLDFLESERGDLPPRQRSVRAVFNGSWSRLPAAAQETFARLTVFRGGFSREGAKAVCKTSLRDLRTLVNSSFVAVSADGRYEVHELMRQLGAEQLEAMGTAEATKSDHSGYYLSFLQRREADLKGRRQIEALEEILDDFDNVRSAWNWAVKQDNRQGLDQAQECLHIFFDIQGRYVEGREFFARAEEALVPAPGQKPDAVSGRVLTRLAFLSSMIAVPRTIILAHLEKGLAAAVQNDNRHERAINYLAQGSLQQNPQTDLELFQQACQIFEELNDDFYLTRVHVALSNCYGILLDLEKSKYHLEQAIGIARATGNFANLALSLGNLAEIELALGQYDVAQENIEEALDNAEKMHAWLLIAFSQNMSGINSLLSGHFSAAEASAQKALAQAEEIEHRYLTAVSLAVLALSAGLTGQIDSGLKWAEESNSIAENNMLGLTLAPWALSVNYARLGRWEEAGETLATAFLQAEAHQLPAPLIWLMAVAALVVREKGQPETAVRFLSISKNHPYAITGWMNQWPRLADLEAELKQCLSPEVYEAAWADGLAYDEEMLPSQILNEVHNLLNST